MKIGISCYPVYGGSGVVATELGNTPAICRKCYIHPQVLDCYLEGDLVNQLKDQIEEDLRTELDALKPEEAAVMTLLRNRLARDLGQAD